MSTTENSRTIHHGRNVKRFREMLGMKQETLAYELGDDWTQKKISLLEGQETIEENILKQVAEILKVTPEALKNFDVETAVNVIANTFNDDSQLVAYSQYNKCTFNAIEKFLEALDDLKNLHAENKSLYERLLASEREKIELLKKP